jgi:MGT family glycosyltransferase
VSKTIFFNIPAHGHVNPSLPVITELVKRGEQVICVNTPEFRTAIESTGAQFCASPDMHEFEILMENASAGNFARNALAFVQIGEKITPFVREVIEREKPDYVIFDSLAGWAEFAARWFKLPSVAFFATFVLDMSAPPPMPLGEMIGMGFKFLRVMPEYWRTTRRIRSSYGLPYNNGLINTLMNAAQLNLVFTSPEIQPNAKRFATSYKFVGASIQSRAGQHDFAFDQLQHHPLVYISLGTINNRNLAFYRECFAAFGEMSGQFILSAGKQMDLASLGTIPNNFIVRNFVPQLELLQRVDVFITHGGLNSVHEGLYYGVPLIVIPQQLEQGIVAQQVVKHGAGLALGTKTPIGQTNASELQDALAKIMQQHTHYKQNAQQLGETLRAAGGYARAADEILAFVQHKT